MGLRFTSPGANDDCMKLEPLACRHMYIDLEGRWDGVFCVTPRTPTRRSIHRFPCDLVSVQKWEMLQSQGGFPFKSFKTLVEFEVVQRNSGQTGSQVSLSVHKWHVNKDTKHPLIQGAIGTLYLSGFRPPKKKQPEYHWFQSASMLETSCQLIASNFPGKNQHHQHLPGINPESYAKCLIKKRVATRRRPCQNRLVWDMMLNNSSSDKK